MLDRAPTHEERQDGAKTGVLTVKVVKVTDLPSTGLGNAFCRVAVVSEPPSLENELEWQQSTVKKRTRNPRWEEEFQFSNVKANEELRIEVREQQQ